MAEKKTASTKARRGKFWHTPKQVSNEILSQDNPGVKAPLRAEGINASAMDCYRSKHFTSGVHMHPPLDT